MQYIVSRLVLRVTESLPLATLNMPGRLQKTCENCKKDNPLRRNSCKFCNHDFKKKRGRPVGTTRSAGYAVGTSGGRPRNTAETDGYLVYKQGGRLTKAENDRETSGKPTGEGSGCRVGKSSGRPIGTTKMNGYGVGLSGGVYTSSQSNVLFKDDAELPDEWDTSSETVNVDDCCVDVLLELFSKERLIVNLLLLGCVIPVVGFYGIPVMPTTLALSHLLVE